MKETKRNVLIFLLATIALAVVFSFPINNWLLTQPDWAERGAMFVRVGSFFVGIAPSAFITVVGAIIIGIADPSP